MLSHFTPWRRTREEELLFCLFKTLTNEFACYQMRVVRVTLSSHTHTHTQRNKREGEDGTRGKSLGVSVGFEELDEPLDAADPVLALLPILSRQGNLVEGGGGWVA